LSTVNTGGTIAVTCILKYLGMIHGNCQVNEAQSSKFNRRLIKAQLLGLIAILRQHPCTGGSTGKQETKILLA